MNSKNTLTIVGLVVALAVTACTLGGTATQEPSPTTPREKFLATAPARKATDDADRDLAVSIALKGMEPGTAGVHVLRPTNDPQLGYPFDCEGRSGGFSWRSTRVCSPSVSYPCVLPASSIPGRNLGWVQVSHSRLFENGLCTLRVEAEPNNLYRVVARVDQQARNALAALFTRDMSSLASAGMYIDWFGLPVAIADPPTSMIAAVVWNDTVYLPLDIGTVSQSTGEVVVADGLTQRDATELATALAVR